MRKPNIQPALLVVKRKRNG